MLSACGGGGGGGLFEDTSGGTTNPAASAASILVTADKTSITTDNLDTATIQAVVKDASNRLLKDVPVEFTSSLATGDLRVLSSVTDASGVIEATFKSGTSYSTGLAIISAKVTGTALSNSVPIVVEGSSFTADVAEATLQTGQSQTVTYTATTGGGEPARNVSICLDFNSTYLQVSGNLSATSDCAHAIYTDVATGRATISVQAIAQGNTTLRAEALGITTETAFTITQAGMSVAQPVAGATHPNDQSLQVQVNVPGYSGTIRFATTAGTWSNGQPTIDVAVGGGVASATLSAGMPQGRVDITATKLDGSNSNVSTYVYAYDPVALNDSNTFIKLEIAPTSLPAGSDARADLKATVQKDLGGGNLVTAPPGTLVSYQISASTGGGEYITLPTDDTDPAGIALSQLVAGSTASAANGVKVRACVVGTNKCAEESLTIVDQPGSITIGEATIIRPTADDTAYEYPLSVIVSDVNGGLLSGVPVNLSVWPVEFATGCRNAEGAPINCSDLAYTFYPNEDLNMNVTRDVSESPTAGRTDCGSGSCALLPPNSAAGTLPSSVTTGSNGLATFNLTYLKEQASFLRVRVTARASVQGSEVETSKEFVLRFAEDDKEYLPQSPYNQYFR
ncbi:MAG: Ig-like domain-containing protein [Pseudomonadota bacterium]